MGILPGTEVAWPMDQVEIKVVQLELGKRIVERSFNMSRIMLGVPELGCNENILTLEALDVFQGTLDALRNFFLILVAVIGGKN